MKNKILYDLLDDCHSELAKTSLNQEQYQRLSTRLLDAKETLIKGEEKFDIVIRSFLQFLKQNGYFVMGENPKHVPGNGYTPNRYYKCDIDEVITEFLIKNRE